MSNSPNIDADTTQAIEAQAFRKLVAHLQKYPDVQNIDLMNLAYFCRNCIAKWYRAAAQDQGIELDYDQARELVYGMPYAEYKTRHQKPATADKLEAFKDAEKKASV